jgi:oligosaccharide reducing-end xylanase
MKRIYRILLICGITLISNQVFSQTIPAPYEVATWPGFRAGAISYTFDDGCSNQLKIAVPLFDKYEFKLTLFTVTNWVSDWPGLKSAAANGHEVASHTVTHPNFGSITLQQQTTELKNSKDAIESHIADRKCISMAYPYCATGNDSVCGKYYISARGCQGFIEPKTPGSYFNVSSIGAGNLSSLNTLSDFKSKFASVAKTNGWCVFLFHGIDSDGGYSPIASSELRRSIEYLSVRKGKFWVTTFLNATLYSKERDAVKVTEASVTDLSIKLQVTDTLPDSIYNFPLTLRRPLPTSWPSANATQNGVDVPIRIVLLDSVVYLTFDVVPDAGEVKLTRNLTPVTPEVDTIPADNIDPLGIQQPSKADSNIRAVFTNGKLLISLSNIANRNLNVSLYDVSGITLFSQKADYISENEISVDIKNAFKSGVYFVSIFDGKNSWSKKIVIG